MKGKAIIHKVCYFLFMLFLSSFIFLSCRSSVPVVSRLETTQKKKLTGDYLKMYNYIFDSQIRDKDDLVVGMTERSLGGWQITVALGSLLDANEDIIDYLKRTRTEHIIGYWRGEGRRFLKEKLNKVGSEKLKQQIVNLINAGKSLDEILDNDVSNVFLDIVIEYYEEYLESPETKHQLFFSGSNVFTPMQISLSLHKIHQRYDLPKLTVINDAIKKMVELYLRDAEATKEPKGSISFWPTLVVGDKFRNPLKFLSVTNETLPPLLREEFKFVSIPNDNDTSSQAFQWLHINAPDSEYSKKFQEDFIETMGNWVDYEGRKEQHVLARRWKKPGSGAFFTWRDQEGKDYRIPGGINDVDCVVNLNILTAIGVYERDVSPNLVGNTETAKEKACSSINEFIKTALEKGAPISNCSTYYYDDPSHFFASYARALSTGLDCLQDSVDNMRSLALKYGTILTEENRDGAKPYQTMTIGELLGALKELFPPEARPDRVVKLIRELSEMLLSLKMTDEEGNIYFPEGSLFLGEPFIFNKRKISGYWYSKAASTATALEALLAE